jgi:PPOX class probable F420-dependent enzyme
MTEMTKSEWREFLSAGTRLGHAAISRDGGRPHVTPICFVLEGDEVAFELSPMSVKGESLARDPRIAICVSDERQPYSFVTIEGEARISAEPEEIRRLGTRIGQRYYADQPADEIAESFVEGGFRAVRISVTKVIARTGLG